MKNREIICRKDLEEIAKVLVMEKGIDYLYEIDTPSFVRRFYASSFKEID